MRGFILLFLISVLLGQNPSHAFIFHKKDYKKGFLQNALNAERRNDTKQAFHSYEKAMYYYGKDTKVIESYAQYCERQKYFDKAENLYARLYILTKDTKYLFKQKLCSIKNGKLSDAELKKIVSGNNWSSSQARDLHYALIFHYSHKEDWKKVKSNCDKLPKNSIDKNVVTTCIAANEKLGDSKAALSYYLRFSELYPNDTQMINKIIVELESSDKYSLQEKYIKKLIAQNPNDNGIKYKLAGFYEKQGQWLKAVKVYEALMLSGDRSEHVTTSYKYALLQQNKPKIESKQEVVFKSKPLSPYKIAEKNFYKSWGDKNYSLAQTYLEKMLKEQPENKKLLRHKVDIDVSQGNFTDAIKTFEKIQTQNLNDQEFLAFLYSKNENNKKALEIIESKTPQYPKNEKLFDLALQYALADKNWDKAIIYNDKLLEFNPGSTKLLKNAIDLYSIENNFKKAEQYGEKLIKIQPDLANKMLLANLYMAGKDFEKAEYLLFPLYKKYPNDLKIVNLYLNSLLAQQKTYSAYEVARKNNLMETKEGYAILGDLNLKNKKYETASLNYFKALEFDPEDTIVKNNLAYCYRMQGCLTGAAKTYREVLEQAPGDKEALLGLGSIQIDRKNYEEARQIFKSILKKDPSYRPAKIATAHSYIANDDKLSALEVLDSLPDDDETRMMKGQIYYDFSMPADSKRIIKNVYNDDSEELKLKIKKDEAILIEPRYSFFFQQLADEFNLDYQKYGLRTSQKKNNKDVYMEYNVYWYSSGSPYYLNNVTNEFRGGVQQRVSPKWEYKADLGAKAFQFGDGAMIVTDSWIKHYFSDKFDLKLGIRRNNLEQSYLSAVGENINGQFVGRVADTKVYLEFNGKLPFYHLYTFGMGSFGCMYAQNLRTNPYFEGMLGVGRLLYNDPRNPWFNTFAADVVTYNSAYQYNLLNLYYNVGGVQTLFGGYFSPSYFNATTLQLKAEGNIKKWHLKYGIKGFGGVQIAESPDYTRPTWGFSPYITYEINDHISINASYNHYNFADITRDVFFVNAVIRGFKKNDRK